MKSKRQNNRCNFTLESLESRLTPAASLELVYSPELGNVLHITGTESNDVITVSPSQNAGFPAIHAAVADNFGNILVQNNFNTFLVDAVWIEALDGHDNIYVNVAHAD